MIIISHLIFYNDSLVIVSNDKLPVKEKFDDWSCCSYSMIIKANKEIKKYYTEGKGIDVERKRNNANSLLIFWDIRHRKKVDNRIKKIVIEY